MDVYEELEEAKVEIEKLKVELGNKTNSLQSLKKFYNAQASKIQKAIFKVEKLNQELLQKANEINDVERINEDINGSLNNKESTIKRLSVVANDESRENCDEKFRKWEDERRGLGLALKNANDKVENQEQLMHVYRQDIESLKSFHSISNNKSVEIERKLETSKELGETCGEVYDALDRANIELEERICERSEMEFELRIWKSIVERLRNDLEESIAMRKELEHSLLEQIDFSESLKQEKHSLVYKMEEKENKIDCMQQHVILFEQQPEVNETKAFVPSSGETTTKSFETVEVRYLQIIEEKDKILEEFQKEVLRLEQESLRREFERTMIAKSNKGKTNELEKENHIQIMKGRNMKTDELMQQVTSLEQKFTNFLTSISLQFVDKQAEIIHVKEACDKITAIEVLVALEVEEKKLMILELEDDIHDIEQKLKLQEENWRQSKQLALDIEEEIDAKQLQIKELIDQIENKLRGSDIFLQKLKIGKTSFLENATRLSSEKENSLGSVLGVGDKMSECTTADTQLADRLRSIVQYFENYCLGLNSEKDDELLVKENMIMHSPTEIKKLETFSDIISPFK